MKLKLLFIALITLPLVSYGQKYKVVSGSYKNLVGIQDFDFQFDFSEVTFYNEKMSEKDYLEKRKKDKDADDIDQLENHWEETKTTNIPKKTLDVANKNGAKGVNYYLNNGSKHTIIVRPQWIYPGWFGGVMKSPSKLTVIYDVVETDNPENVLLSVLCTKAVGDMYPMGIPNTNHRIAESFAHAGKGFVRTLRKKVK